MGIPFNIPPEAIQFCTELLKTGIEYGPAVRELIKTYGIAKHEAHLVMNEVYNTMYTTQIDMDPYGDGKVMKPEVITKDKPSDSTRKDDNLFKKARRDGDEAILNTVRSRGTTLSLGRSISFNNMSFLGDLLNRRTKLTVSGGYHYNATVGARAWHMQHYRHNAYQNSGSDGNQSYTYHAIQTSETRDAGNSISLLNPTSQTLGTPSRTSAFKPVDTYSDGNGATDQYAPFSLVDLENASYRLQGAKNMVNAITFMNAEDTTPGHNGWHAQHLLQPRNEFAARSHIFQHNQYVGDQVVPSLDHPVVDNNVRCKPCLLGGKIQYLFMNTGTAPASVTVIVYKVKQGWVNNDEPVTFKGGYMRDRLLQAIKQAYLDKGEKLRLKTMGGRVPLASDVTSNPQFQFLPKLKPVIGSAMPYVEQMRYNVVIAAGQTKDISITLPGRMYDPTSINRARILSDPSTSANKIDGTTVYLSLQGKPQFWSKEQYSVAIGVAGCPAVQNFNKAATPASEGVAATPEENVREGVTTTAASVTCRVKYTERIGAMNMELSSKPTIGADTFDPPNADAFGTTNVSTVALVPVQDVTRTAPASGVMPL